MQRAEREKTYFDSMARAKGIVWWGHTTKAGQRRLARKAKMAVERAGIASDSKILEIGCGSGDFTRHLSQAVSAPITAVDISPELVIMAREKINLSNVSFAVADVTRLPFPDGFFDAVLGNSILHHLNLKETLPEIRRVLKEGGRLCVSEPNMLNPQVLIEKNIKFVGRVLQNSPDETAFLRWRLKSLLAKHGFSDIKITPFDFLHPLTPNCCVRVVSLLSRLLERIPLIRELAGSLIIYGVKSTQY